MKISDELIDQESFVKETLSMSENRHMRLRFFGITFVVLNIFLILILAIICYIQKDDAEEKNRKEVSDELDSIRLIMSLNIKSSLNDIFFLSDVVDHETKGDVISNLKNIETILYGFIKNSDSYDQARFINSGGLERVRVNRVECSSPQVLSEDLLQDKSDRQYFREAINLSTNIAYISQLDLNVENGKVEVPYKLVLRIATPVYNRGILEGIIVLNFLGSELLYDTTHILKQGHHTAGDKYFILNGYGDPLAYLEWSGKNVSKSLLGFDAADTFRETFKLTSQEIFRLQDGVYARGSNLFAKVTFRADATASGSNSKYGLVKSNVIESTEHDESDLTLISLTHLDSYWDTLELFVVTNIIPIIWLEIVFFLIASLYSMSLVKQKILENAIKSAAAYDPLTSLYNRRFGMLFLKYEIRKIGRTKGIVTLFVIDVNNLKTVNDTCGHNSGDELIKIVADRLRSEVRESDIVCRIGGDEFIVAFSGTGLVDGNIIIERVRAGLETEYSGRYNGVGVDFSYGGAEYDLKKHQNFDDFVKDADARMYEDKKRRKKGCVR